MRPNAPYRQLKRALFSVPALLVLAVIVASVSIAAFNMYGTYKETRQRVSTLKQERRELVERKQAAQSAVAEIATKRGLKEEIREKFSVAKPGERVIVLTENKRRRSTTTKENADGWWQWIKESLPW